MILAEAFTHDLRAELSRLRACRAADTTGRTASLDSGIAAIESELRRRDRYTARELDDAHALHVDAGIPRDGCPSCEDARGRA